jgi:hypothetical protein
MYGIQSAELQISMSSLSYIFGKLTKHYGELILLPIEEVLSLNLLGYKMTCLGFSFASVIIYKYHA